MVIFPLIVITLIQIALQPNLFISNHQNLVASEIPAMSDVYYGDVRVSYPVSVSAGDSSDSNTIPRLITVHNENSSLIQPAAIDNASTARLKSMPQGSAGGSNTFELRYFGMYYSTGCINLLNR